MSALFSRRPWGRNECVTNEPQRTSAGRLRPTGLNLSLNFILATKTSRIPRNLNFPGETAFLGGIFCLEYPSRRSEKVNCHFVNYRLSFRKLQILISQTTDPHFANYRSSFRKLQILISQTTDFHFANYRFQTKPSFFLDFGIHYTCSFPPLHFSH